MPHYKTLVAALSFLMLNACVAPIVVAGAGAGATNVGGSTLSLSTQWDDVKIETQIDGIFNRLTPELAGANLERTVFNGIVLVLGQVPTAALKRQIAADISTIKGVNMVYNQMTVGPSIPLTHLAEDIWITTKVKTLLAQSVNPLHFKVVTESGIVYLMGHVTQTEANEAVSVAQSVAGVQHVVPIFSFVSENAASQRIPVHDPVVGTDASD